MSTQDISRRRAWVMTSRPQTLPTAAVSVVVGTAVAIHADLFIPLPIFAVLMGTFLTQVGANFINDCYDVMQSTDTEIREGLICVTAGGLIPPPEVRQAAYLTFVVAVLLGAYLVYVGSVPILVAGLPSIASGIAYAGSSHPLSYHSLGDLFVPVFFGPVVAAGAFYVQATSVPAAPPSAGISAKTVTLVTALAGLPIATISANILVVNSVRDKEEDATASRRALAVQLGYGFARAKHTTMLVLAYAVPVYLWTRAGFDWFVLLPVFSMPVTARIARTVMIEAKGEKLDPVLEDTGKLLALYAVLFSIGLVLV